MTRFHAKSMKLPNVWLMSDERIDEADFMDAVRRLPRGSGVVLRHYGLGETARRALFDRVKRIARRKGHVLLLAGSADLARVWGADGHHGPRGMRSGGTAWLHSAPVHDHRALIMAQRQGADLVLISPLFATRSHPGARPLGVVRFAALARLARVPVMALGGVRPRHARLVRQLGARGYAAIDGLVNRRG